MSSELETRQATAEEQRLIDDILLLYQLKPSHTAYDHYAENAVFHDPISIARGKESVMSQFNGMPKIFARSETKGVAVLATSTPQELQVNLDQHYVFKSAIPLKKEGMEKTVNSKLTFKLNAEGLIEEHLEEWDHKPNKTSDDGFLGKLMEGRKKLGAKLVDATVSSDPNKV